MLYDAVDVYDKKNDVWEGAVIQSFNKKGDVFEVLYDDGGDVAQARHTLLHHARPTAQRTAHGAMKWKGAGATPAPCSAI